MNMLRQLTASYDGSSTERYQYRPSRRYPEYILTDPEIEEPRHGHREREEYDDGLDDAENLNMQQSNLSEAADDLQPKPSQPVREGQGEVEGDPANTEDGSKQSEQLEQNDPAHIGYESQ